MINISSKSYIIYFKFFILNYHYHRIIYQFIETPAKDREGKRERERQRKREKEEERIQGYEKT